MSRNDHVIDALFTLARSLLNDQDCGQLGYQLSRLQDRAPRGGDRPRQPPQHLLHQQQQQQQAPRQYRRDDEARDQAPSRRTPLDDNRRPRGRGGRGGAGARIPIPAEDSRDERQPRGQRSERGGRGGGRGGDRGDRSAGGDGRRVEGTVRPATAPSSQRTAEDGPRGRRRNNRRPGSAAAE